jgi:hypothetical protein
VLLLSSPTKNRLDEWQILSGAFEEAGPDIQVRPLGTVACLLSFPGVRLA